MNQLQQLAEQASTYNRKIEMDVLSKKSQKNRYIKYQQLIEKNKIDFSKSIAENFNKKLTLEQINELSLILNEFLAVVVFPSMTGIIHSHKKICLVFTEYEVLNYDIHEFEDMFEFLNTPLAHNVQVQEGIVKMSYEIIAEILSDLYNDNGLNIFNAGANEKEIQQQFEKDIEKLLSLVLEEISKLEIKDLFFIYENKDEQKKYKECLEKSYLSNYQNNVSNIKNLVNFITSKNNWELYLLFNKGKKDDRIILINNKELNKIEKDIGKEKAKEYLVLALSIFLFSYKNLYIYTGYIKELNINKTKKSTGYYDGILFLNDTIKRRDEKRFQHLELKEHNIDKDKLKRIDLIKKANLKP